MFNLKEMGTILLMQVADEFIKRRADSEWYDWSSILRYFRNSELLVVLAS